MKINVTNVGAPWRASETSDPMYTINIEGQGEVKTFDASLAVLGEHEAESFQSKGGKTYWRIPKAAKPYTPTKKSYEADPNKISSIEMQKAIAEARQLVRDWYEVRALNSLKTLVPDMEVYKKDVVNAAITLHAAITIKPNKLIGIEEPVVDPPEVNEYDLPPVENYEGLKEDEPVNLDEIPF